jgi:opacity protein-like surface antigen
MKISRAAPFLTLVMLAATGEVAGVERGFYIGGAYSSVSADYSPSVRVIDMVSGIPDPGPVDLSALDPLGSNAWRVLTGYRASDWLAFEGDFSRFEGNRAPTGIVCVTIPCPALMRGEVSTTSLSALGLYPVGKFDLFARAGLTRWRAEVDTLNIDDSNLGRVSESDTDLSYGAGAQFHVERFTTRLEYQRLRFGEDTADLTLLGVTYSF